MARSSISRNAETAERMRCRIAFLGVTPSGHPIWNGQETHDLVEEHPDYNAVMQKMWRRTRPATRGKACRLKITRPRAPAWTDNEILRLRKVYPRGTREEILAAFPGRTFQAVAKAANSRGIFRAPKPYKPSGNTILDQIQERARRRNWTLVELDQAIRGRGYFSRRRWKNGALNHRLHWRAVELLGGVVKIRWVDG